MKEYAVEAGKKVDLRKLVAPPLSKEAYAQAHRFLPIACHDVIIEYNGGLLLVVRDNHPAKNIFCVIGGRINRGMPIVESLKKKVQEECGLELENIRELGVLRTFFQTDPFGHKKGTDTFSIFFYARGKGKLKLDHLHKKPVIVTPNNYTPSFRNSLHPYVRNLMDQGMEILREKAVGPKLAPRAVFEEILQWAIIPTFDLVLEYGNEGVILVKRKIPPYQNQWALPGLRILKGESINEALCRIARDELGLSIDPSKRHFLGQYTGKFKTEHQRQDLSTGYWISIPTQKISLNSKHFSALKIIKNKREIPKPLGAMYQFYIEKYFERKRVGKK